MNSYEIKKLKIETKSPIHIGSHEQKITRFEFLVHGNNIYPVSEERLAVFLQKKNLIASYCVEIERRGHRFDLAEFFRQKGISLNENQLLELSAERKIKTSGDVTRMQEYRGIIRDGFGTPYIPGTSIKGVIRTAIFYNLLKQFKENSQADFKRKIEDRISADIDKDPKRKKKSDLFKWANIDFFENFRLLNKENSPNTDWLRLIHVSDAYSEVEIQTVLIPVNILKKEDSWRFKEEYSGQKTTIWIECIPENTVFEFEIKLDRNLLAEFKRQNNNIKIPEKIEDFLEQINNWATNVKEFEKNFFANHQVKNWYEKNPCNFRIGSGSGMVSTTILMLLDEDLRKKVRNYAGLNKGNAIAPKSRRVFQKDSFLSPLGWCLLYPGR